MTVVPTYPQATAIVHTAGHLPKFDEKRKVYMPNPMPLPEVFPWRPWKRLVNSERDELLIRKNRIFGSTYEREFIVEHSWLGEGGEHTEVVSIKLPPACYLTTTIPECGFDFVPLYLSSGWNVEMLQGCADWDFDPKVNLSHICVGRNMRGAILGTLFLVRDRYYSDNDNRGASTERLFRNYLLGNSDKLPAFGCGIDDMSGEDIAADAPRPDFKVWGDTL